MEKFGNEILGFLFKNKIYTTISIIIYLVIYKIIDMNTLQWFGDDIFVREGNLLEFFVCGIGLGSFVVVGLGVIINLFRGKLF
jgi:hypothetical protein